MTPKAEISFEQYKIAASRYVEDCVQCPAAKTLRVKSVVVPKPASSVGNKGMLPHPLRGFEVLVASRDLIPGETLVWACDSEGIKERLYRAAELERTFC